MVIDPQKFVKIRPKNIHDHEGDQECLACQLALEVYPELEKWKNNYQMPTFDLIVRARKPFNNSDQKGNYYSAISSIRVVKKITSGYNFYGKAYELITDVKLRGQLKNVRIENICGGMTFLPRERYRDTLMEIHDFGRLLIPREIMLKICQHLPEEYVFPQFTNENPIINPPMVYDRLEIRFEGELEAEIDCLEHMYGDRRLLMNYCQTPMIEYKGGFIKLRDN